MSKLRIEKLKQGSASNNDVLVFRNDLGTFQGQSNLSLNTITLGSATVNSSVYTGAANNALYLNGQPASYYADASGLSTAYSNAVSQATTLAGAAYSNAVSVAAIDASNKAATAYSNAIAYSGNAALAYANAILYAAANTYVNDQLSLKANTASPTFTGTLAAADITVSGNLNSTGTISANVLSVSNVEQTQTNLQVDPAGSAFLNAIIYG